jgi:hypothetical protein
MFPPQQKKKNPALGLPSFDDLPLNFENTQMEPLSPPPAPPVPGAPRASMTGMKKPLSPLDALDQFTDGGAKMSTLGPDPEPGGGDSFWGDSFASQTGRRRAFAEADSDLALDLLDKATMRNVQRGQQTQPMLEDLEDQSSERAGRRAFLPQSNRLFQRNRGAALEDAETRYLLPAQITAESRTGAARLQAQGRQNAATITANAQPQPRNRQNEILLDGLMRMIEGNGGELDPAKAEQILQFLAESGLIK